MNMAEIQLTDKCKEILSNFGRTGEDFDCLLGKVISGSSASIFDIINYAQVFANKTYCGSLASKTAIDYSRMKKIDKINGLKYDRFTSHVLIDSSEMLGNLKETYTSTDYSPFYKQSITRDFSDIIANLGAIAKTKKLKVKTLNSTSNSKNSICDLVNKIYDVCYAQIGKEFSTNLEKVTAAIFATMLTTRAMDLSTNEMKDCEVRLNEALKLSFCTHLNACHAAGSCALNTILRTGSNVAVAMIEGLGYTQSDILDKYERLGTPIKDAYQQTIFDALFGAKKVREAVNAFADDEVNEFIDGINGIVVGDADYEPYDDSKMLEGRVQNPEFVVAPAAIAAAPARILLGDGRQTVTLNPGEQVAGANEKIAKEGEQVAKTTEKVVDKDARVAGSDEVVHDKGNAINYNTLRRGLLEGVIAKNIDNKIAECTNRAEKQQDLSAIAEGNFWAGAKDGVCGLAQKRSKTESYNEGHKQGQYINAGIIQEIDKMYSADKKKLIVDVKGQGKEVTKQLSNKVANAFSFDSFADFTTMIMSSLLNAFNALKEKSSKSSKDDQTK